MVQSFSIKSLLNNNILTRKSLNLEIEYNNFF